MEVLKEQLNNVAEAKKDVVKKVISKLEIDNKSAFQISILITDPDVVNNLDSAIVDYLKSDPYVKRRIEITKKD